MGKKALCIGINTFKNYSGAALYGCVNDAYDMSSMLQELLGFAPKDVTILTDAHATKANIMRHLQTMVKDAVNGDYHHLVLSFSGHGTQVPDLSGDEDDAANEVFCPFDLVQTGDTWHPDYIITDNELHDLFVNLPQKVLLEVYLDTSHSGSGVKAIDLLLTRQPRYIPPPSLSAFKKIEGRALRGLGRQFIRQPLANHILWSGCRADQTSADTNIDGVWHGAFTYYYCHAIRTFENRLSRKSLLKKVREELAKGSYTQVPQLECNPALINEARG